MTMNEEQRGEWNTQHVWGTGGKRAECWKEAAVV
jgi:hypothetical protein